MALTPVTPAAVEPVTVAELKAAAVIDGLADDDAGLAALIGTARTTIERRRSLAMITQTWTWSVPAPAAGASIPLPLAPVRAGATVSVSYRPTADATPVSLASTAWRLVASDVLPRIVPAAGVWPVMAPADPDALTITFAAGYGAAGSAVPLPLRREILVLATALYDRREVIEPGQLILAGAYGPLVF